MSRLADNAHASTAIPASAEPVLPHAHTHLHARRWWLFPAHVLASVLIQSSVSVGQFMIPYLAKKHFGAGEWMVLLFTAAPLVLPGLSVFWQHAVKRLPPRQFLALFWLISFIPWALAGYATTLWQLAAVHVVCAVGYSAWAPVSGEYLSRLYPAAIRGRMFGVISIAVLGCNAAGSYFASGVLDVNPETYRTLLPIGAALTLLGVTILVVLQMFMPKPAPESRDRAGAGEVGLFKLVLEPVLHMREILRQDRVFLRYEAAYMTYGIGWMIVWVMLPLIGVKKLNLGYNDYSQATNIPMQLVMLLFVLPCGFLNDRIGAAKVSAMAFALYVVLPLGLVLASSKEQLGMACALWGVSSAAVQMGWTLGPVGLAPSPDKVSQYMAIHATLVGLRGAVCQTAGIVLLMLTDSFGPPLVLASAGFAWAAWQMWSLRGAFEARVSAKKA